MSLLLTETKFALSPDIQASSNTSEGKTLGDVLFSSPCKDKGVCRNPNCEHAVAEYRGRWYILFGHAGYNSRANNAEGYSSEAKALAAMRKYIK